MDPTPPASSETVARRFRRQPRRDTAPELAVRRRLHARGVRYRQKDPVLPTPRKLGAVPWTGPRLVVFLDGCFWRRTTVPPTARRLAAGPCTVAGELAGNTARDRRADAVLRAEGWQVLRFWEHEDPDAVADAICRALGRPVSGAVSSAGAVTGASTGRRATTRAGRRRPRRR